MTRKDANRILEIRNRKYAIYQKFTDIANQEGDEGARRASQTYFNEVFTLDSLMDELGFDYDREVKQYVNRKARG